MNVLIPKQYTNKDHTRNAEAPGYQAGRTAGGWIHDLCALRKVVTLCPLCMHKFNPRRLGYLKDKELGPCIATCDGCKVLDTKCAAYFWEESFHEVRSTSAMRRAERTAWRKQAGLPLDGF